VTGERPSAWITRERPKIDRIACPWLVLRFIDPRASFHYVPAPTVFEQAAGCEAVAYDLPGAPITHEGDRCSFDALLRRSNWTIRRSARWPASCAAPTPAGWSWRRSRPGCWPVAGLSQLHADDHAMLQAALPLYDALYAWCRSAPESHR
jgi:hypothetical protein